VKLEAVIVVPSIARENVAVTAAERLTLVAPSAGEVEVTRGAFGSSSVMFAAGVLGEAFMSASTFVVACWIRTSGVPFPLESSARPRDQ
jgi:hypothetical protein